MGSLKIVTTAMVSLKNNRVALFHALFVPVLISLFLSLAPEVGLGGLEKFILNIIDTIINTIIAVTTHRIVLLGPDAVNKWSMVWTRRETRFLLVTFTFSLAAVGIIFSSLILSSRLQLDGWLVLIVVGFVISYLLSRLYLVYPAVAIGQAISFKHSWELTRKHQFLVWFSVVLFPVLAILIFVLLLNLPFGEYLFAPLIIVAMILTVAVVSIAYQYITGLGHKTAVIEA